MKTKKTNQQNVTLILTLVIVAIILVAGYLFLAQKGNIATPTATPNIQFQQPYPAILNNSDLNTAANNLDNTDISQIDTQLNQLNSDASAF